MQIKRAEKARKWLSFATPAATLLSAVSVTISMVTNGWLETTEQIFVRSFKPKNIYNEPRIKRTVSGLWLLCVADNFVDLKVSLNLTNTECSYIDYFGDENYAGHDADDSTLAIPLTVTKSGPIFFTGYCLLVSGVAMSILGYFWRQYRMVVFISGVLSIISGLVLFVGVVVYLSVLQAEVGTKLRSPNSMDKPPFAYSYGYGLILMALGSIFTEITGTCVTLWYIHWHQLDWAEKTGLRDEGEPGHSIYTISGSTTNNPNTNIVGPENPNCPAHRFGYSFNDFNDGGVLPGRLTPIIECPGSSQSHHSRRYRYESTSPDKHTDNFWEDDKGAGAASTSMSMSHLNARGRGISNYYDDHDVNSCNDSDNEEIEFGFPIPTAPPPPILRDIPPPPYSFSDHL